MPLFKKLLGKLYELLHHPLVIITFVFIAAYSFYKKQSLEYALIQFVVYFPIACLVACSRFFTSKWLFVSIPSLLLSVSGILFIIMHWPYGKELCCAGFGIGLIGYLIYSIQKPDRSWVDYCKILFALAFLARLVSYYLHWPFKFELNLLYFALLYTCFIALLVQIWRSKESTTE